LLKLTLQDNSNKMNLLNDYFTSIINEHNLLSHDKILGSKNPTLFLITTLDWAVSPKPTFHTQDVLPSLNQQH